MPLWINEILLTQWLCYSLFLFTLLKSFQIQAASSHYVALVSLWSVFTVLTFSYLMSQCMPSLCYVFVRLLSDFSLRSFHDFIWRCGSEVGIENSICGCKVCLSLFRHHCPQAFSEEYKRVYINKLTRVILICGQSYIFTHYFMMSPTSHNRVLSRFMSFCI